MKLILIIEDENELRFDLEDKLRELNYPVLSVGNGKQGIHILDSFPVLPQVILLDSQMPIMNGREFANLKNATTRYSEIPVVFMSEESTDEAFAMRNDLIFLQKPFKFEELLGLIGSL